jgi:hypothetical protein
MDGHIGPYEPDKTHLGDCLELIQQLPDASVDVVVTSPPYWGQRTSLGAGVEDDPRDYLNTLIEVFRRLHPKLKESGIAWINIGDAYNTPVNWRLEDHSYSSLGPDQLGLAPGNSAYVSRGRSVAHSSSGRLQRCPAKQIRRRVRSVRE